MLDLSTGLPAAVSSGSPAILSDDDLRDLARLAGVGEQRQTQLRYASDAAIEYSRLLCSFLEMQPVVEESARSVRTLLAKIRKKHSAYSSSSRQSLRDLDEWERHVADMSLLKQISYAFCRAGLAAAFDADEDRRGERLIAWGKLQERLPSWIQNLREHLGTAPRARRRGSRGGRPRGSTTGWELQWFIFDLMEAVAVAKGDLTFSEEFAGTSPLMKALKVFERYLPSRLNEARSPGSLRKARGAWLRVRYSAAKVAEARRARLSNDGVSTPFADYLISWSGTRPDTIVGFQNEREAKALLERMRQSLVDCGSCSEWGN
jgi:hypothetical protein